MVVGVVILALVGAVWFMQAIDECSQRNGVLVRGAVGYACVAGPSR